MMNYLSKLYAFLVITASFMLYARAQNFCNGSILSYCGSCRTQQLCQSGTTNPPSQGICGTGQVCQQSGTVSICTAPANVAACQCTGTTGLTQMCDPYDSSYILLCNNGAIISYEDCEATTSGEVCVATSATVAACGPLVTTTTVATTTLEQVPDTTCGASSVTPVKRNCTAFYICSAGQLPQDILCNDGEVFSENAGNCVAFGSFNCPAGQTAILGDPFNCTIYHTCVDGTDNVGFCTPGTTFDSTTSQCSATATCTTESCTPCKSADDAIPVDSTQCVSTYYQCIVDTDNVTSLVDDGLTVEVITCPSGFLFDPVNLYCTRSCVVKK